MIKVDSELTEFDVWEIRNSNDKNIDIAKKFGIDNSTVSRIKNGEKWKHSYGVCLECGKEITIGQTCNCKKGEVL
jgi:RNA polymerase-binding transcription factor DksA